MPDPAPGSAPVAEDDAPSIAIEHARLRWEAEVQNADRLSTRENGLLTVIAGVLGIGLFRISDVEGLEPAWMKVCILLLLVVALTLLLLALHAALKVRGNKDVREERGGEAKPTYASAQLRWPAETDPATLSRAEVAWTVYARVNHAASDLYNMNLLRTIQLDLAQQYLFQAAAIAAFTLVCGMIFGRPLQDAASGNGTTGTPEATSTAAPK